MIRFFALLAALCFVSCVHTAVAPICNPAGEPVAIRVPGVAKGARAKPSQLMAIDEKLVQGITADTLVWKYFPELEGKGTAAMQVFGVVGEVKTKREREDLCVYLPLVALQATAPPQRVEEAAAKLAADLYKRAKSTCEVYPLSQLVAPPKKP